MTDPLRSAARVVRRGAGRLLDVVDGREAVAGLLVSVQDTLGVSNPLGLKDIDTRRLYRQMDEIMARSNGLRDAHVGAARRRVLFIDMHGHPFILGLQGVLAHALRLRGASCHHLVCSGGLPKCQMRSLAYGTPCNVCFAGARQFLSHFKLPFSTFDDDLIRVSLSRAHQAVSGLDFEACASFTYAGLKLGEMINVSVTKYFLRGRLERTAETLAVQRDFLATAMMLVDAYRAAFDAFKPDTALVVNGKFTGSRVAVELARSMGIEAITYENVSDWGYGGRWFFSRGAAAVDTDLSGPWRGWREVPLTAEEKQSIDQYLTSRTRGTVFYPNPEDRKDVICRELGLDPSRQVVTLLTNCLWDSAVVGMNIGFRDMLEWLEESIRFFSHRETQLVIRIHPAETANLSTGFEPTLQRVADEIRTYFPRLPQNVRVIPPESNLSSYALVEMSDLVLTYTTTVGLEAATRGRSVVVSGDVHYRGKGFTYDPATREEYLELLDRLLDPATERIQPEELAKRYAYLYFFRSQIPVNPYVASTTYTVARLNLDNLNDLRPGHNPALDLVCDGILGGGEFVMERKLGALGASAG